MGGLNHATEISKRVANFHALIKPRATDNAVIKTELDEALFKLAHLERGADEDGDVIQRMVLALKLFDLFADGASLFFAVPCRGHIDLLFVVTCLVGKQGFAKTVFVVADEVRGGSEDVAGGAIITFQLNDLRAGEVFFKAQNVIDFCPAPAVNRLVIITHTTNIRTALGKQAQPHILRDVGVLVLVHEDILKAALIVGQHIGVLFKQPQAFHQQVAKVAGV